MKRLTDSQRGTGGKMSVLRDERGLTTVEYVIVLVLIAVAAITVWGKFGEKVKEKVTSSTQRVEELNPEEASGDK
jgi:Flp pilus assembly pilin Flp